MYLYYLSAVYVRVFICIHDRTLIKIPGWVGGGPVLYFYKHICDYFLQQQQLQQQQQQNIFFWNLRISRG